MNQKEIYYVYFHLNPTNESIFYIGIGTNNRAWDFNRGRSKHYKNYIKKYGNPTIEIKHEKLTKEKACLLEIEYIKKYGRIGYDEGGILLNKSLGGESGVNGTKYTMTEEHRNNIIKNTTGKKKTYTKESKEKLRQSQLGRKDSEETKNKRNESLKNRVMDWGSRNKKASETLKGRKITWNLKGIKKSKHKRKTDVSIEKYTLDGEFISKFSTISEAAGGNLSLRTKIHGCLQGKYPSAGGYVWKKC
jgi:hypothetical protein